MTRVTRSRWYGPAALLVLGILVASCSNPPGRIPDAERGTDAGPGGYPVVLALDDVRTPADPAWAADEPSSDAPPAPRDWLRNLVGRSGNAGPDAPSP